MQIQNEQKAFGLLGFAARARKLAFGAQAVEQAIKREKAMLVIADEQMSDGSYSKLKNACEYRNIPLIKLQQPGHAAGKAEAMSIAVLDKGFATGIIKATQVLEKRG